MPNLMLMFSRWIVGSRYIGVGSHGKLRFWSPFVVTSWRKKYHIAHRSFFVAGLEPATYRLEVCRATFAPHETVCGGYIVRQKQNYSIYSL